ncbi:MAG: metallophosphoesterase [Crocinitomicaceae bacterium]
MRSKFISFSLIYFACFLVCSQTLTRGPYLQSPTENTIVIKWRTSVTTNSKVSFGTDSLNLSHTVSLNNSTKEHTVKLTNLAHSTTYYYSVGNNATSFTSPSARFRFKTNPIPGSEVPTRVWAIGDFGKGNAEQVAVKNSYMHYDDSSNTNVWIWLGDNVYNDGTDEEYQTKLFELNGFSDVFSWLPFWPSPGNHDYNTVWEESAFLGIPYSNIPFEDHQGPYYDMVHVPTQAEAGGYPSQLELFYSFDYGDVHFLSLNSEVYDFSQTFEGIDRMKQWIEQDLQQNTRTFTIAYFHQPPYSKGSHDSDDAFELVMKAMRERVVPLLEEYDIDLVICGHSHVFERSKLIHGHYGNSFSFEPSTMLKDGSNGNFAQGNAYHKDGLANTPDGTVYVVCGNSGSKEDAPSLDYPIMQFVDGGLDACGSFVMDIYKNRLDGKYLHMNGSVLDEFTILKSNLTLEIPNVYVCGQEQIAVQPVISGGSDNLHYAWSINNQTSPSISINNQQLGSHQLVVTDSLTGQVVTQSFTILQGNDLSITAQSDTLYAQGTANNYQWYLNSAPISGANSAFFIPQVAGNYSVATFYGTCLSESVYFNPELSVSGNSTFGVTLYPNPAGEEINIDINQVFIGKSYQLFSSAGEVVKKGKLDSKTNRISLAKLPSGTYTIRVNGAQETLRFVKK